MRICARSGCNAPAVATLSYDRIALVAYLVTVDDQAARQPGDLCERHTAKLVLPREWQLDDRRVAALEAAKSEAEAAPTKPAKPAKKLRVVKDASVPAPAPAPAKPARTKKPRTPARPKWTAAEPSLFDSTSDTVAPAPASREDGAATEPVWMPRFDRDDEPAELDATTPLLKRAFGGR